jgi:hypothetical protein
MKFLQSTKTGSVWIAQDAPAQKMIDCQDAVELTREQYASIMSRRSESFTIGQSGHIPHRVTFMSNKVNSDLFLSRIAKEGIDRADIEKALATLFSDYAHGAMLVMKGEAPRKHTNEYLKNAQAANETANEADTLIRELSDLLETDDKDRYTIVFARLAAYCMENPKAPVDAVMSSMSEEDLKDGRHS